MIAVRAGTLWRRRAELSRFSRPASSAGNSLALLFTVRVIARRYPRLKGFVPELTISTYRASRRIPKRDGVRSENVVAIVARRSS